MNIQWQDCIRELSSGWLYESQKCTWGQAVIQRLYFNAYVPGHPKSDRVAHARCDEKLLSLSAQRLASFSTGLMRQTIQSYIYWYKHPAVNYFSKEQIELQKKLNMPNGVDILNELLSDEELLELINFFNQLNAQIIKPMSQNGSPLKKFRMDLSIENQRLYLMISWKIKSVEQVQVETLINQKAPQLASDWHKIYNKSVLNQELVWDIALNQQHSIEQSKISYVPPTGWMQNLFYKVSVGVPDHLKSIWFEKLKKQMKNGFFIFFITLILSIGLIGLIAMGSIFYKPEAVRQSEKDQISMAKKKINEYLRQMQELHAELLSMRGQNQALISDKLNVWQANLAVFGIGLKMEDAPVNQCREDGFDIKGDLCLRLKIKLIDPSTGLMGPVNLFALWFSIQGDQSVLSAVDWRSVHPSARIK